MRIYGFLLLFLWIWWEQALAKPLNIKPTFLMAVEKRMAAVRGHGGLSDRYFSVGDPAKLLGANRRYLLGVSVDPAYLANFKWGQYTGWSPSQEAGLAQPKGEWWGATVSPKEMQYNGWIVLQYFPTGQENEKTAFHEAIHAFHLEMGSDVDQDAYGGPETISNNYWEVVGRLRLLDKTLDTIVADLKGGKDVNPQLKNLQAQLKIVRGLTADYTPQTLACLKNIGGRMDWKGYLNAIDQLLKTAQESAGRGPDWKLAEVTVDRSYVWNPPTGCVAPGSKTYTGAAPASVDLGWDGTFKSGLDVDDAGKCNYKGENHAHAIVTFQAPATLKPGTMVSFSTTMQGNWSLRGYGVDRDHTISISGDTGSKKQTVGNKLNGNFSANLATTGSVVVPWGAEKEFRRNILAEIRFGGDSWGRANITLHYRR